MPDLLKKIHRKLGIKYSFDLYRNYAREFGLGNALQAYRLIRKKNAPRLTALSHFGFDYPIYLRAGTADVSTFEKIFIWRQYQLTYLKDVQFILDVGANIGLSSLWFARQFPQATIGAIEPEINNFQVLSKNTEPYLNIKPLHAAVWSETCRLFLSNAGDRVDSYRYGTKKEENDQDAVQAYDIETLLEKYDKQHVDILKIDIEGAEETLFNKNYEAWIKRVFMIIIELHSPQAYENFTLATQNLNGHKYTYGENLIFVRNTNTDL